MKIDKNLNIVVPVERADGTTIYVHCAAISLAVFDAHFWVISKTFDILMGEGMVRSGPRIAMKMLKRVAQSLGETEVKLTEENLLAEIHRLTNVIAPSERGWAPMPWQTAISQNLLDADDVVEVENAIAFFIVASSMLKKKEGQLILREVGLIWGAQIISSNSTAYLASLPTSIPAVNTGEKKMETPSFTVR